jgi:hypothetical protein
MKISSFALERRIAKAEMNTPAAAAISKDENWWVKWMTPSECRYVSQQCEADPGCVEEMTRIFRPRAEQRRAVIQRGLWYGATHESVFYFIPSDPWSLAAEINQIRDTVAEDWDHRKLLKLDLSLLSLDELEVVQDLRHNLNSSPPRGTWVKVSGVPLGDILRAVSRTTVLAMAELSDPLQRREDIVWQVVGRPLTLEDLDLKVEDYPKYAR